MTTENNEQTPVEQTAEQIAAAAAQAGLNTGTELNLNGGTPPTKTEEKPEQKEGEASKIEPVHYEPSGDAGLDMLLEAAGNLGLDRDHPAMQAAVRGDFDLLGVELAKGDVKGADRLIQLGKKAYDDVKTKTTQRMAEDLKAVHQEVGGEERWKEVQKWARENADESEAKEISTALGRGGLQARMAAAWLSSAYARATGVSDEGAGRSVSDNKGAASGSTNSPLSPQEYGREVAKARIGFKGDFEASAVYKQLQARRMAYRR